jgi:hypothetical protein
MIDSDQEREGLKWQTGVWNRISDIYLREIDRRFVPLVEAVIARAVLTRTSTFSISAPGPAP